MGNKKTNKVKETLGNIDKDKLENIMMPIFIVLMIILVISSRLSRQNNFNEDIKDNNAVEQVLIDVDIPNNYYYQVDVNKSDELITYLGKRDNNNEEFSLITTTREEFRKLDDKVYIKQEENYTLYDQVLPFYEELLRFSKIENIKDTMDSSNLISTNEQSKTYLVSSDIVINKYLDIEYDRDVSYPGVKLVVISIANNLYVEWDFSELTKNLQNTGNNFNYESINLTYYNYNLVPEIKSGVNN